MDCSLCNLVELSVFLYYSHCLYESDFQTKVRKNPIMQLSMRNSEQPSRSMHIY